jgi:tRNA(fMet)-specific endonuclease VapC
MYLLDTDTLTRAHMGHSRVVARVQQAGEANVATTVITAIEIVRGRHDFLLKASDGDQLLRAQELLRLSEMLLQEIEITHIDAAAAGEFDKLRQNRKLKAIGRKDLLIACIALAQKATVVTRNLRHFQQVPWSRH